MSQAINVNGQSINYPETGDTNWGDEATNFAVQTSAALGKLGLASGTSVDIAQTLDVTGNTTLDANLSVGGNASVTGNTTLTGNITVNGNSNLGNGTSDTTAIAGILNVDSGVLYVDPVNNRVGINDATPSQALDVTGNALISGTLGVTGATSLSSTLAVTGATSLSSTLAVTGNSTLTGNLSVNGNTTLGDASGDSLTINSNAVSIPNGLNFDNNTLVIDAANNRVGIARSSPSVPLDIQADGAAFGINIRGRTADNIGILRFLNNAGTYRHGIGLWSDDSLNFQNASTLNLFNIAQNGQLSAVVSGGSTLYPGYLCRAWVNFDGTLNGTIDPRGSGNISSVVKNSTGNYTISIDIDMPDANYSVVSTTIGSRIVGINTRNAGNLSITTVNIIPAVVDTDYIGISVFR